MKKLFSFTTIITILCLSSKAQTYPIMCNTYNAMEEAFVKDPTLRAKYNLVQSEMELEYKQAISNSATAKTAAATVYTVPVVFHILHQGGVENILDADVITAMAQINKDYSKLGSDISTIHTSFSGLYVDAEIRFQLANKDPNGNCTNGIIHHYDANTNWNQNNIAAYAYSGTGTNRWPVNKYLNIYIVKCIASSTSPCPPTGGFIVGYTYLPGGSPGTAADAIVYRYDFLATGTEARSLSHEIGHWLNLTHVFGPTNNPGISCGDDGVTDTPVTKGYFSTCPGSNAGPYTGCTATENMENFMDYSSCPKMFTQMQVTKMRAALTSGTSGRSNLWTAGNLLATGITPGFTCTPLADLKVNKTSICSGSSVTYTDLSQYGSSGSIAWVFEGGSPATSTSATPVVTYNTPGTYSVSLTATNAYGVNTMNKVSYINVVDLWSSYTAPVTHDFESGAFPWLSSVTNGNPGSVTWQINNTNGATGTAFSIFLNNASQTSTPGHLDIFETPTYNFSTTSGLSMSFYYAYAKKNATQADTFKLQISTDCGGSWQNVLGYPSCATMASNSAGTTSTPLNPTAGQWKQHIISSSLLSATSPNPNLKPSVKFRFYFRSDATLGSSNNLFIDQINLTGVVGINEIENSIGLSIYPNPTNSSATMDFNVFNNERVKIKTTDVTGRVIEETDKVLIDGNHASYIINKNGQLAKGVYFINLEINNSVITKKLIIQ